MRYDATVQSLQSRPRPAWFDDAKFGIFIHWGLYSVPAYAPIGETDIAGLFEKGDLREVFRNQPYAEWYLNSIRIPDSSAAAYHAKTYGADYSYFSFADAFNDHISAWDPTEWARLFKRAGAGYVTLVTKHHDGFLLWPSRHAHPHRRDFHASRNIVGELTEAVRSEGVRMAYYYSSLLDWSFTEKPITDFVDLMTLSPTTREYVDYQEAHWRELLAEYGPAVLWSDIGYPPGSDLLQLFADYYNAIPGGLVNDRWNQVSPLRRKIMRLPGMRGAVNRRAIEAFNAGSTSPMLPPHYDFTTPEYSQLDHITPHKWEATRGIGRSFAYNQYEPDEFYLTPRELISSFVDIISKNGNLLLNVGPSSAGEIPPVQRRLLEAFGDWMARSDSAVRGSRPWTRFGDNDDTGEPRVRFTRSGDDLNVFLFPRGSREMIVDDVRIPEGAKPRSLTTGTDVEFDRAGDSIRFKDIAEDREGTYVVVIPDGAHGGVR